MNDAARQDAAPFRIVVWGPGGLGTACIYEIAQRADYQLVGVRCYDRAKEGQDAGTLTGIAPLGVAISADPVRVAQIECDAIVYTRRDLGNYNNDAELLWLLGLGRNVITALPYQHVRLTRDAGFVAALEAACEKGRSVFFATGVDPDTISDRVLAALSGLCSDITGLHLQENWDQAYTPHDTQLLCGFGKSVEEARNMPVAADIADNFLRQVRHGVGHTLGVDYTRVESSHEYVLTERDIPLATGVIPAGWILTIEGRPSVRMVADLKASIQTRERFIPIGERNSEPGYHAVTAACLQSVPRVLRAPPGIPSAPLPPVHWRPDQRKERVA